LISLYKKNLFEISSYLGYELWTNPHGFLSQSAGVIVLHRDVLLQQNW